MRNDPALFPSVHRSRSGATVWPIAVGLFYGTFAAAMIGFTVWTTGQKEDLVSPDYYARTVVHQDHLNSLARARAIPASLAPAADGKSLVLQSPGGLAGTASEVRVSLYRPSSAALDRKLPAAFDPSGSVALPLEPPLAPGHWRASLAWTLDNQPYLKEFSFLAP